MHFDAEQIKALFDSFRDMPVLVIGDLMLDAYIWGETHRISPEAPVPVVSVKSKEYRLGGAANVALNLKALGANPVLCSVIGDDEAGRRFRLALQESDLSDEGLITSSNRPTTLKSRIMARNQQMLRLDEEGTEALNQEEESALMGRILRIATEQNPQVAIMQDYNKGVLSPSVIAHSIEILKGRDMLIAVDPKKHHFFDYRNVDLVKPNLREAEEVMGKSLHMIIRSELADLSHSMREKLSNVYSLITLSEKGLFLEGKGEEIIIPSRVRRVADVSGAGDTVISVASLGMAAGASPGLWAMLANIAGGQVCEKVGVVPLDPNQLLEEALSQA